MSDDNLYEEFDGESVTVDDHYVVEIGNEVVIELDIISGDKKLPQNMRDKIKEYGWEHNGIKECFDLARNGAIAAIKVNNPKATPLLQGSDKAIAVAKYYGAANIRKHAARLFESPEEIQRYSEQWDIIVDQPSAENALNYIQKAIDNNLPVVVGVNAGCAGLVANYGEITDHYVVIYGYEFVGEKIKKIFATDNATKPAGTEIEFNVDDDGKIFKEGNLTAMYTYQRPYQIDLVRVWKDLEPDNQVGVGAHMSGSSRRQ